MEKFKYIIIFTLVLVLGITYYQLHEYKKISQTLILENNQLDINNNNLQSLNSKDQNTINELNELITKQKEQISSLHQSISSLLGHQPEDSDDFESVIYEEYDRMIEGSVSEDNVNSIDENYFEKKAPDLENEEEKKEDFSLEPGVGLNENNEIESVEIKLKKSF